MKALKRQTFEGAVLFPKKKGVKYSFFQQSLEENFLKTDPDEVRMVDLHVQP